MTLAMSVPSHLRRLEKYDHAWGRSADRALRKTFALLPNAHQYAAELPQDAAEALDRAGRRNGTHQAATDADAATLRPFGLCEFGGGMALTNFGVAVRLAMIASAR